MPGEESERLEADIVRFVHRHSRSVSRGGQAAGTRHDCDGIELAPNLISGAEHDVQSSLGFVVCGSGGTARAAGEPMAQVERLEALAYVGHPRSRGSRLNSPCPWSLARAAGHPESRRCRQYLGRKAGLACRLAFRPGSTHYRQASLRKTDGAVFHDPSKVDRPMS